MDAAIRASRVSAPNRVREKIRKDILEGRLPPGSQLRQDELAEKYGVSRIPVREALSHLQAEGLVILEPNRGAAVAPLSLEEVLEMLEIRIALECRALRLAIPNMVEADFQSAKKILSAYDRARTPAKWSELCWDFHHAIYAPANLPKLLAMIKDNYWNIGRFTRMQVSMAAGKERPQREHYELVNLCMAGDIEKAVGLLEEHIGYTQKSLTAAVRRFSR